MKILLINCSSDVSEFAIAENDSILVYEKLNRVSNADSLIYSLISGFSKNDLSVKDLNAISVSNGPGSFTGLRVGLAVAKGLCFANDLNLILLSSLDIIAQSVSLVNREKFICTIPSNMKSGEVYFAVYEKCLNSISRLSEPSVNKTENLKKLELPIYDSNDELMKSQLDLTLIKIENKIFDNYFDSEPFYIKEFIPLKSKGEI